MHAFLVSEHFFARLDEWYALGGEHGGLRQEVEADEFVLRYARDAGAEAVNKAHVVMATDIADGLPRLQSPGFLAVIHLRHVNLRMADSPGDAEFYALLVSRHAGYERALAVVVERSAQRVAHLVAERGYAGCLAHVGFHGELVYWIGARARAPAFAIDERCGEGAVEHAADFVHCLDVMHAHQVNTEAVDVVFVNPIAH